MRHVTIRAIRPGKTEQLLAWGQEIMGDLKEEALISIAEERITHEAAYIIRRPEGNLLIGIMVSEGEVLSPNMERAINQKHRAVLEETLIPGVPVLEPIYTLTGVKKDLAE